MVVYRFTVITGNAFDYALEPFVSKLHSDSKTVSGFVREDRLNDLYKIFDRDKVKLIPAT